MNLFDNLTSQCGEASILGRNVNVGERVIIWHFCNIMDDVEIGDDVSIGSYTEIGSGTAIGYGTRIGAHVFIPKNSLIGNHVFIGPGVIMCDDKHPVAGQPYTGEPPTVEDDASIGAGAIILPGVLIGSGAMIGAGAVVTRDVAAGDTVAGVPAGLLRLPSAA